MSILKKILWLIFVTGVALVLIIWIFVSFAFRSPIFAFLVNWLIMSWVAVMGQFVTFPLFPSAYYEIKPFERTGRFYERLGVHLFKKVVRGGLFSVFSPTLRFPAKKTTSALKYLENEMWKAETSHVAIFLLILLLVGYALFKGWWDAVAWLLLINILFNGYPVLLQRYNRIKIQDLINSGMTDSKQEDA